MHPWRCVLRWYSGEETHISPRAGDSNMQELIPQGLRLM